MASIITWMNLAEADKPSFVVDTAALIVAVTIPATPYLVEAGSALNAFPAADNILILEYGIKMPECFEWAARAGMTLPHFTVGWAKAADGTNLTFLTSKFVVPAPNVPVSLRGAQQDGFFFRHYSLQYPDPGVAGKLYWKLSGMSVSMANVPDSLHGTTQYLEPWVRIQHQVAVA